MWLKVLGGCALLLVAWVLISILGESSRAAERARMDAFRAKMDKPSFTERLGG